MEIMLRRVGGVFLTTNETNRILAETAKVM